MSQTWGFSTEILKHFNVGRLFLFGRLQYLLAYTTPSKVPLVALCNQLKRWNADRVSKKSAAQQSLELTLEDVNAIRNMILAAVQKTSLKQAEIMSDQLLFLTVGAIQIQAQTGADKAWSLVNQSVLNHLSSQKEKRMFAFGLLTITVLLCLSTAMMNHSRMLKGHQAVSESPLASIEATESQTDADPVTLSLLQLTYHKMQSGTCQLPQAAMLPEEQRRAFLLFVNKGIVEVQNVENLRLALGYVNCLYPQELMRPLSVR